MGTDKRLGEVFERYANPNNNGESVVMDVKNVPTEFEELKVTNGCSYARNSSYLQEKYIVEKFYDGKALTGIKLNGFK